MSLFCLLKAVADGWQQEAIANNARGISDLGKQLYERIQTFLGYLDEMRKGLVKANDSFDDAVRSLNGRVLPGARRFKELGATTGTDIDELEPLAREPRALSSGTTEIKVSE